jgi:hypothetical protein
MGVRATKKARHVRWQGLRWLSRRPLARSPMRASNCFRDSFGGFSHNEIKSSKAAIVRVADAQD